MSTHRGRRSGPVALAVAVSLVLAACTAEYADPYVDAPPLRPAAELLEDVNLAAVGLRAYDCDLFEADVARCYDSRTWGSVDSGRETLAHVHRELLDAGARYYGGSDHSRAEEFAPKVAGLDLACYFDYQAADMALRVAVVGPSGELAPCQNGLPAEGVSEVWIIGADFDVVETYERVEYPPGLEFLLSNLPPVLDSSGAVYGGTAPTEDGYYGPELPLAGTAPGVEVLAETVSIRDGVARGLVQYVAPAAEPASPADGDSGDEGAEGEAATQAENDAPTGAWGVIVRAGDNFGVVPVVIRPGESAPFEFRVSRRTKAADLEVLATWVPVTEGWRGALYLTGPTSDKKCGDGAQIDGKDVKALDPGKREKCWVVTGQTTTLAGDRYVLDAIVATFNPNGKVKDVFEPYLLRGPLDDGPPTQGRINSNDPNVTVAWVTKRLDPALTGVWMRYAKVEDLADSAAATQVG